MSNYNENYIKEAAYYLWQNAGCPNGQDEKFWSMALEQYANCSCSTTAKKSCCKKTCSTSSSTKKTTSKSTKTSSKK
ncbi:MAG: DUF2934 domain-containing protein [Alphaproteobacteria bacterium]|nr:DUF2934 domain-containing protein [Alphaproteobacteria bacterium]